MNFSLGTTFEAFKKDFYSKSKDFSLYDCGNINIIKVVLDGLKVNYISKGKLRVPFFYPDVAWNFVQFAQRRRNPLKKELKENKSARILIADLSGRSETIKNNIPESFYFDKLLSEHKTEEYVHVVEYFKTEGYPHHIDFRNYVNLQYLPLTLYEKELRKNLLTTYKKIENSKAFNVAELSNIQIAIQSFFCQFKIWNELLTSMPSLKYSVIEQHYHHEGLLLALKKNNIKSYEIQHGLISESDIFYVFPKGISSIKNKALFPDKILVYGNYWKDVLLKGGEFGENDIVVTGDFRKKNNSLQKPGEEKIIKEFISDYNIILISSQTFMHEYYDTYTKWLSELLGNKHKDWKIILKLHPNEKEENYTFISNLPNVLISKSNILYLFAISKIHISVYSTTLYDALEYKLANFSLTNEAFKDYTQNIVFDKVAISIDSDEDPVSKFEKVSGNSSLIDSNYVYSGFSGNIYKNLFLN
ncbi:MAG TPA: hypothetical protein VNZ49_04415 [Bacteroidia bacterium]|jgi:hypothetical protein|nr:hypothetical protein [Bacteroidia bacterium]